MTRGALLAATLLVVGVGVGGLLWQARPEGSGTPPPQAPAAWTLADGSLAAVAESPTEPAADPPMTPPSAQADAAAALGPDCGYTPWLALPGVPPTPADKVRIGRQIGADWLSALQGAPDPLVQAAGLWLGSTTFNIHEPALADCRGEACRPVLQRLLRRVERLSGQRAQAADALQAQALASGDPRVVSLAVAACDFQSGAAATHCLATLSARWTAVDPDNAAAWLQLARVAHLQGDTLTEGDAVYRASLAPRYQPPSAWMPALLEAQLPPGLQGEPRLVLQIEAAGVTAGLSGMAMAALDHCRQAAAEDANRAQTCLRLAELMLAQAPDLMSLNYAEALGRHAGWNEDRLATLRSEREALMAVQQRHPPAAAVDAEGRDPQACQQILQGGARLARFARQGELAALRALRRGG